MISYVQGEIIEVTDEYVVVKTVNGVGYRVHLSMESDFGMGLEVGKEIEVFTSQYFRENDQGLYGFKTKEERRFYELLVTVSGVGPKLAAALLAHVPQKELAQMIFNEDIAGIVEVPGIGKKMAERLIIELRDKVLSQVSGSSKKKVAPVKEEHSEAFDLVIHALSELGFSRKESEKMEKNIRKMLSDGRSVEEVLKAVLSG